MKTLLATLATLALLAAASSSLMAGATKATYRGNALTTVYYMDALTGKVSNMRSYTAVVSVTVGNPTASSTGKKETNPFSLTVTPSVPTANGAVTLVSAVAVNSGSLKNLFVQHWTISNTSTGFTGKLTNNGSSYGMASNGFQGWADYVPGRPSLGGMNMPYSWYDTKFGSSYQASMTATEKGKALGIDVKGWAVAGTSLVYATTSIVVTR